MPAYEIILGDSRGKTRTVHVRAEDRNLALEAGKILRERGEQVLRVSLLPRGLQIPEGRIFVDAPYSNQEIALYGHYMASRGESEEPPEAQDEFDALLDDSLDESLDEVIPELWDELAGLMRDPLD